LIRLRRPTEPDIGSLRGSVRALTYPEVGATAKLESVAIRAALASRYDLDHHEFRLGVGRALFERARSALLAWRHFAVPWVDFHGPDFVATGQVVATAVCVAGLWFVNPCRVVYVEPPDGNCAAYAYGTLPGHAESGEERFQVSLVPVSEAVVYELFAFSRPAILASRIAYPLARRIQRRFAVSSARALARALE
jgi:uncharacterized protein (UPF0548 family)